MKTEIVKELPDWGAGDACLVKKGDEYFVVSSVVAMFTGFETLAFRSDKNGEVQDWQDVAGGQGSTRDQVIAELDACENLGFIEGNLAPNELQSGEE